MSAYPALEAMGIRNPKQISRYAIYDADGSDILRITYERKKGSILPVTKKFKFPQLQKSTLVDSGTRQTEVLLESSAEFRNAVAELDGLMDLRDSKEDIKRIIAEEIRTLEEEVAAHTDYIKSLVDRL